MGTDCEVYREAKLGNKWYCVEPLYSSIEDEGVAYEPCSVLEYRNYQLFGLMSGVRWLVGDAQFQDFPRGFPDDMSDYLKSLEFNKREYTYGHSYATFEEIDNFINKWHDDMILTGKLPEDFIDEDGMDQKIRFDSGMYKDDNDKRMAFYEELWKKNNVMLDFRKSLDILKDNIYMSWKNDKIHDFAKIPTNEKRIVFYYDD